MTGRRSSLGLLLAACLVAAGCRRGASVSPSATPASEPSSGPVGSQPAFLLISNVDGPDLVVVVNGEVVGSAPCGGGKDLVDGDAGLPALPWSVQLREADGTVLLDSEYARSDLPFYIKIRGHEWAGTRLPISGPVGTGCPPQNTGP